MKPGNMLGVAFALLGSVGASSALAEGAPATPTPAPSVVHQIKITTDKAPDCSSLASIVETVTRGCRTNDEKAVALYNFMQLTHYHQGYPSEKQPIGALKEINVYGWSLCGGLHTVEASLWRQAGWKWRYVGWSNPAHTTVEAFYNDRWHYLDVFLRFYTWMPDTSAPGGRTIAGQADIKADSSLITKGLVLDKDRSVYYHAGNLFQTIDGAANWTAPCFLDCGDEPGGILTGVHSSQVAGSPTGWMGIAFDSPGYSTDVNLKPGESLDLKWSATPNASWWGGRKAIPAHSCGDKDYRNSPAIGPILEPYRGSGGAQRSYASGQLDFTADLRDARCLSDFKSSDNAKWSDGALVPADPSAPASVTIELQSPYILTRAHGDAQGVESADCSVDGGKTYRPIKLADFSDAVGGNYSALVRLRFKSPLKSVALEATVEQNRCALPYLSPGRNHVTVSVADPRELGDSRLVVTYAYETGERDVTYAQLADEGAELARAHGAHWSDTPIVVQKVFSARDLPATFEIDVPTPAGKQPVYPRMISLQRQVVAANAPIPPLPPGAVPPPASVSADDLRTLPNPFTIGIALPPKQETRATHERTIDLKVVRAVSADGRTAPNHFLKSKPAETWALLVTGDLKDLPPAKNIASAELIVPIVHATPQSATKLAATVLAQADDPAKPFDFARLGPIAGTAQLPAQPGADFSPPKPFAVDVTRAVRGFASGETSFHGFALRTIQDRAIDQGWTTRADLPDGAAIQLRLEVYADSPSK